MRKYITRGLYQRKISPQYNLEWTEKDERNYKLVWKRRGLEPPVNEFRNYHRHSAERERVKYGV